MFTTFYCVTLNLHVFFVLSKCAFICQINSIKHFDCQRILHSKLTVLAVSHNELKFIASNGWNISFSTCLHEVFFSCVTPMQI